MNWKTGLVVALLGAVVFGATVISQLSPKRDEPKPGVDPANPQPLPLVYTFSDLKYDPKADDTSYHHRLFRGFFEVGSGGSDTGSRNWTGFAMRNLRTSPAILSPLTPSCSKCTSARVTSVPDDAMQRYFSHVAAGSAFSSPFAVNPLMMIGWADAIASRQWFHFDFTNPNGTFTIPAGSPQAPTWVLLELDFKISQEGPPRKVHGFFDLFDSKKERLIPQPLDFNVVYAEREAFEVWPKAIAVGDMPEGTEPRTFDIYSISMTRDSFPPPSHLMNGDDGTVSLSPHVPMTPHECETLAYRLSVELKSPVRVRSGYRQTLSVRREKPGTVPECGDFEKIVDFGHEKFPGVKNRLTLKGVVTGAVQIDGAAKIDLGDYNSAVAMTKQFRLTSEKTDLELELVPDRCGPAFVQLALGTPVVEFGRKTWPLTATIAEQQGRKNWTGTLVVRTKGPNPAVFRFPMTGFGR